VSKLSFGAKQKYLELSPLFHICFDFDKANKPPPAYKPAWFVPV